MRAALRFMRDFGSYFSVGNEASVRQSAFFVKFVRVVGVNLQSTLACVSWKPGHLDNTSNAGQIALETPTPKTSREVWAYLSKGVSSQPRQAIVNVRSFFDEGE